VKDPTRFVFNAKAINRPSDRQTKYYDGRANPKGKNWDDVWIIPRLTGTSKERIPDFPTQLPLELLRPIVGCASDEGDLVVDPFCGSATTGIACLERNRRFLGIEKSHQFASSGIDRMLGYMKKDER
jgi:site-specific DNA-methyltransferase (adenine-specific)